MNEKMNPEVSTDIPSDLKTPAYHNASEEAIAGESELIYIDPVKEAACRKKFDKYVVPVSVIFLVLSTLDRNNVSEEVSTPLISPILIVDQLGNARVFGFDEDLGLKSGQFGNIQTLSSVSTILFEVPWVLAVKRWGSKKSIGTAFILWSILTLGTAFIHTYAQAIVIRMLLNAAEAGLAQGFAFLFSTIYPRELAGKRIMTTNLAQCISGAFGGLFAYAIQTMGNRNGFAAWRWLFVIEFLITIVICGSGLYFLPDEVENAWFLNEEEKETMRLKKKRDFMIRGNQEFERKWVKAALTDPFVYMLGIAFFTSSVAINGFGVFLPTIISGLG
jgi:MFS family permease